MTESVTLETLESAVVENVAHCARERIYTGGGIWHLQISTMRGSDPAGVDYGPTIRVGPFSDEGEPLDTAVSVWEENDDESGPVDGTEMYGHTLSECVSAMHVLIGRETCGHGLCDPIPNGYRCQTCGSEFHYETETLTSWERDLLVRLLETHSRWLDGIRDAIRADYGNAEVIRTNAERRRVLAAETRSVLALSAKLQRG